MRLTRTVAGAVALVGLSVPVSIALTILLFPFWRWIEETFSFESIGHSGPAEWCYVATYLVLCISLLSCARWLAKSRSTD